MNRLNPYANAKCPTCGKALDAQTRADGAQAAPSPGDVSICFYCGELLEFGDRDLVKLTDEKFARLEPPQQVMMKAFQSGVRSVNQGNLLDSDYDRQLGKMKARADEWRKANRKREVKIQFNWPPKVMVICAISDAIKRKLVTTNEAGLELIKALGNYGEPDGPTVLMVRVVLESEP